MREQQPLRRASPLRHCRHSNAHCGRGDDPVPSGSRGLGGRWARRKASGVLTPLCAWLRDRYGPKAFEALFLLPAYFGPGRPACP
ncbi:hypothetical protein VT50_0235280 [Streptomyces antioxidans]|uniref:Uncharacterized protein n=1 Tax=Streptomyces antioxidans TaxID=1507734 RepID=A0A1V4CUK0_9ACTN|nr:hypothetical protein VT50_0235280 [Streptomyces antioxidans]